MNVRAGPIVVISSKKIANATPVPTTPSATTAAIGPMPGASVGASAIANGVSRTVAERVIHAATPVPGAPGSLSFVTRPPIA